jgi:hypothetical protein
MWHAWGTGKVIKEFNGKPKGKRPHGRPRCRWTDNIKMYFQEVEWKGISWIDLAKDRDRWRVLVNSVMKIHIR